MTYDEIVCLCKQLEYKDKLRLVQSLLQMAKEEEELNVQGENSQQASPLSENAEKVIQDVAKRLMKLKPNKRSSLSNSIASMFQFQGGISESDKEAIISELQRLQYIKIDKNDKVKYPRQQPLT